MLLQHVTEISRQLWQCCSPAVVFTRCPLLLHSARTEFHTAHKTSEWAGFEGFFRLKICHPAAVSTSPNQIGCLGAQCITLTCMTDTAFDTQVTCHTAPHATLLIATRNFGEA